MVRLAGMPTLKISLMVASRPEKCFRESRNTDFFRRYQVKSSRAHPWEIMVAMAAPGTPFLRTKINSGSRIIFSSKPLICTFIGVRVSPWAVKMLWMA